jgi:hypothetical protein
MKHNDGIFKTPNSLLKRSSFILNSPVPIPIRKEKEIIKNKNRFTYQHH